MASSSLVRPHVFSTILSSDTNSDDSDSTIRDCAPLVGDDIERTLRWQGDLSASALAGQTVRLRFVLEDADLYAFCFAPVVI